MDFQAVLKIVQGATTAGPAFAALLDQVIPLFAGAEQAQLKDAYAKARQNSDDAQDDFVNAGRGR